jgi:hypothetical protein
MRSCLLLSALCTATTPGFVRADEPQQTDTAAIDRKIAELEGRLAEIVQELGELRRHLAVDVSSPRPSLPIMTPQQAHDAYRIDPCKPVTVEFGVERGAGAFRTGFIGPGPDPIWAIWDGRLQDGHTFEVYLMPEAYRALRLPGKRKGDASITPPPPRERDMVAKHVEENGLRVTGVLQAGGYSMVVTDPSKVVLYLAQQPGTETYAKPNPHTHPPLPREIPRQR